MKEIPLERSYASSEVKENIGHTPILLPTKRSSMDF